MKFSHRSTTSVTAAAFTLIELLVVVALVAILLAMMPCAFNRDKVKASRIQCVNHLKQVGLSCRLWAGDNGGKFPAAVSTNNGGIMELVSDGHVHPYFAVMSNELVTPKLVNCLRDERIHAANFASMTDLNISYFISLNAVDEANPQVWLAGDRNVTNRFAPIRGVLEVPTNSPVGWTEKLHKNNGNLGLADGSVQQLTSRQLLASLRAQTNSPLRLVIPQ